jgi:hypothetical protein
MSYDALAHAQIKNNMTNPEQLRYWTSTVLQGEGLVSEDEITNALDSILSNTTIKRACCLGGEDEDDPTRFKVNVRIPIPTGLTPSDSRHIDYGFIDKPIKVPKSFCKNVMSSDGKPRDYDKPDRRLGEYSKQCDDFYGVYCPNMMTFYMQETRADNPNASIDSGVFANFYKPECACYNILEPIPPKVNLSTRCLNFPQCDDTNGDQGITYLDMESRKKCPESYTICTQIANLSGTKAGNDVNVQNYLTNECGGDQTGPSDPGTGVPGTPSNSTTDTDPNGQITTPVDNKGTDSGDDGTSTEELNPTRQFYATDAGMWVLVATMVCGFCMMVSTTAWAYNSDNVLNFLLSAIVCIAILALMYLNYYAAYNDL